MSASLRPQRMLRRTTARPPCRALDEVLLSLRAAIDMNGDSYMKCRLLLHVGDSGRHWAIQREHCAHCLPWVCVSVVTVTPCPPAAAARQENPRAAERAGRRTAAEFRCCVHPVIRRLLPQLFITQQPRFLLQLYLHIQIRLLVLTYKKSERLRWTSLHLQQQDYLKIRHFICQSFSLLIDRLTVWSENALKISLTQVTE